MVRPHELREEAARCEEGGGAREEGLGVGARASVRVWARVRVRVKIRVRVRVRVGVRREERRASERQLRGMMPETMQSMTTASYGPSALRTPSSASATMSCSPSAVAKSKPTWGDQGEIWARYGGLLPSASAKPKPTYD